jgi:uncharacterized membrane protein
MHRIVCAGVFAGVLAAVVLPAAVLAQEVVPDVHTTMKAEVLSTSDERTTTIPGTDTKTRTQTLQVKVLDGAEEGRVVSVEDDHLNLSVGDVFYLQHTTGTLDGADYYTVVEPYRLPVVMALVALFVLCVLVFGGWQGARGLLSLALSFALIFYLLFPGILRGYSPIAVSVGVSALIIVLGSYVTHGFNKTTHAAVAGMVGTIGVTGIFAYVAVHAAHLTGFSTDEAVYLNFNTRGSIDFVGLLLGGILIGLLGVLYDAAIGQAIAVEELQRAGPHLSRRFIFARAIRMGREHIGALVNTLAIAYVGVSLPLLLLFYTSSEPIGMTVNRELFATEIIRTMVGSIGLVLAVPATTLIAVLLLVRAKGRASEGTLREEREAAEHIGHAH